MSPNHSGTSSGLRIVPGDRPTSVSTAKSWSLRLPKPKLPSLFTAPDDLDADAPSKAPQAAGGGRPPGKPPRKGGKKKGGGSGKGPGRSTRSKWLRKLLGAGIALGIWGVIAVAVVIGVYAYDMPDLSALTANTRKPSVTLLSADGETIAAYGDVFGEAVTLATIPKYVPDAIISTEDRRFYSHFGIDPIGLVRAAVTDLRYGHVVQGGSTITQQLAKNLFLSPERSLKRKVQELLLALQLEHRFTKDQILTLYLNRVYLGNGTWGVDAAARRYFGVPASQLNLYQSALIGGLLKAPSRYNPLNDPELSKERTTQVLENMQATGDITAAQAQQALATGPATVKRATMTGRYFADWVRDRVDQYGGGDRDVVVHTTIDMGLQRKVEALVTAMLNGPAVKARVSQGAVVVMSPDGAVRAMVGGKDYADSQFNRATQGMRQPGSSFKAFVYLAAFEAGWRPTDLILDTPITQGDYQPEDFEKEYEGTITLKRAFAKSSNVAAVRLIEKVGPEHVVQVAHKLGITDTLHADASLALGTSETSLLSMTAAYASFANTGNGVFPFGISEIDDRQGTVIFRREGEGAGNVIPPDALAQMNELFQDVIFEGTGRKAALDRPAGGKTGTTQDYRDAWFMGFTADYATGVWLGNDDNTPTKRVTGGTLPAELWHQVMMAANKGLPVRPIPSATVEVSSDQAVGGPGAPQGQGGRAGGENAGSGDGSFGTFVHNLMKFLGG
ncbi:MAG TPA: PBP1A family penicillin-binding protein [Magnetospirillaceae bacterium]|jgi:penicillin-binding protein 1A